ncbi:MAG TPA: NAD(P)/FAD-dependent oxidoreductase [Steroidobacteraceae bacterium]|nr:NAD(P)/FAD-dependent oxidoreductase [Steroidobacteraceae bacterium]
MTRSFDSIVIGGDANGLTAAIGLAQRGSRVLVLEAGADLGGTFREIEFAPGFRAAPLASDAGYLSPEVVRALGTTPAAETTSDPAVVSLAEDEPLLLRSSVEQTAEGLKRFSDKDAQRWPEFAGRMHALAGFLGELYRAPAPRINMDTAGEFLALAKLGRKYRGLGKTNMVELLRTLPMALADLLDDNFESDRLKGVLAALGVMDVCQGPMAGGTAFTFLHRQVGARPGVFSERLRLKGGAISLINALADRARSLGVAIETGTAVGRITVRDGAVQGVTLASGEDIQARKVVSSLDPYRSLLELVDPAYLDPEFIQAVRNIRYRGVTSKILVALDQLPSVAGATVSLKGSFLIAPSLRYVERAYDATKYGRISDQPVVEVRFPSVGQSNLAPAGKHVAVLHVQFTPHRLREGRWDAEAGEALADSVIPLVDRHIPGFAARVRAHAVLSPADIESRFGLREGAISQGEMMLDQILFMRPVAGAANHAMPISGLYLCGASTHPGEGLTGLPGWLAAQAASAR